MPQYYTSSKRPTSQRVFGGIDFFNSTSEQLSKLDNVAYLMGLSTSGDITTIYKPTYVIDKSGKAKWIIGNMNNASNRVCLACAEPLAYYPQVEESSQVPDSIRPQKPLTKDHLVDTDFDSRKKLVLIQIPNHIPGPFGTTPPSTNVRDDDFVEKLQALGDQHAKWATVVKNYHEFHGENEIDEANSALGKVKEDPTNSHLFLHGDVPQDGDRFFYLNPIQDESRFAPQQKELMSFFTVPLSPDKTARRPSPTVSSSSNTGTQQQFTTQQDFQAMLQNANLTLVTQADKERDSETTLGLNKLRLFHVTGKIDWDEGTVSNVTLPTWSGSAQTIMGVTSAARASRLGDALFTVFRSEPTSRIEKFDPLFTQMSMTTFTRPFCTALLACHFQATQLSSLHEESNYINVTHFANQNLEEKVLAIQRSEQEEATERSNNVPESQRKSKVTTLTVLGNIKHLGDVVDVCANFCGVDRTLFDYSGPGGKAIVYQIFEKMVEVIFDKEFKQWSDQRADKMPQLPFNFIALLQSVFVELITFARNMVNLSQLDIAPQNNSPTFELICVETAVAIASRFVNKLKNHVQDKTTFTDVVPQITPDSMNPDKIKMEQLKNEMMATMSMDNGRTHVGDKAKAMASPPGSPTKSSRARQSRKKLKSNTGKDSLRSDKQKTDKKALGWMHCKGSPTKALPSNLSMEPGPCAFFVAQGSECNRSSNKCSHTHVASFSKFPKPDQIAILEKMHEDEGKSAWLDKATFERQGITDLIPKEFKYLLGDENGPSKRT